MAISMEQVEKTKQEIEAAQRELPEAGQFKASISSLRDTLSILKDVWNTDGGAHQTAELASCITELENYNSIIESELQSVKSQQVSYHTQTHRSFKSKIKVESKSA